jgi:pyruvate-ferredoxin/flavodoxin oxidoreductase
VSKVRKITVDGNEAVAMVAHRTNEVIAIYPITPSSAMGELSDEWSVKGQRNVWGAVPKVVEMQAEGGAAGAVHGSLQAGALTTTFTASQGLLLFIPNMYKIAGELNAFCMHVAARSVATHALSIFCDHSDVMACRQTGFALLCSGSVQEAHDFAAIGQAATLRSRVPFLHFFDGFRTSHEVAKIEPIDDETLRWLIGRDGIERHRARGLTPDHPQVRGTAQNPDVFFQAREACNGFYLACPDIVQEEMTRFAERTGRQYRLFDYVGAADAERVLVLMGSAAQTAEETVRWLNARGERVGVLKVRLYRPFSVSDFAAALPRSVRSLAVLDRTKEPGSTGEPLYLDVLAALAELRESGDSVFEAEPRVRGGRYGLSSKEFTPAMVKAVFDELREEQPRNHFTIGIVDDVTGTSLPFDGELDIEPDDVVRAVFYGLGSDGTVGANKNAIKIIGEQTDLHAQGYFVYDSKKSGAMTTSHLRFGPRPIQSAYLVSRAGFVACHQFSFLERYDVLAQAGQGAVFLLNAPYEPEQVWDALPREVQETIVEKKLQLYVIDAYALAKELQLGRRINTLMQTCFFAISGVLPRNEAIAHIKKAIEKSYGVKGHAVVARNFEAVDRALENLHRVEPPKEVTSVRRRRPMVPPQAPDFVQRVTATMLEGKGDQLPVSVFPVDGSWPVGTSKWEKRNIAQQIPVWDPDLCIQCNKCAMVCPHAAIRAKLFDSSHSAGAPSSFKWVPYKGSDFANSQYSIQVAPEDCTGCRLCAEVCPARDKANPRHKAIDMAASNDSLVQAERENYAFFLDLPNADRAKVKLDIKGSQFLEPLFEYSGACSGCGETPYIKLLTQLFGDRALIANATGCSSIFGGNLPTTPYTTDAEGRGPAWSNSLFEDNAEFGLGFRLAVDRHVERARRLLLELASELGDDLVAALAEGHGGGESEIRAQRERVDALRGLLAQIQSPAARELEQVADYLVKKSIWLVGGDGWAYDIGFGGLDHVLASDYDVNILVLDTEVYSNTGGQQSKATPMGAAAKFAVAGKQIAKKDLGLEAMSYGHAYVARVAFGAKDNQTVHAFTEAESYPGPSLIIAYSHCIAHGYDLAKGLEQQKLAVRSGVWPLYRFDPRRVQEGEPPFQLDSGAPKGSVKEYMRNETRFRMVEKLDPKRAQALQRMAQEEALRRYWVYRKLAGATLPMPEPNGSTQSKNEEGR